jgi:hypothetical protein
LKSVREDYKGINPMVLNGGEDQIEGELKENEKMIKAK